MQLHRALYREPLILHLVICMVSKDCSKIIEELKVVVKLARMRRNAEEEQ